MASAEHKTSQNKQCSVCLESCSDPKELSCEHALCTKCYSDSLECSQQNTAKSITCPKCKSKTDVRADDGLDLDTNVPLKSLSDDVKNIKHFCEICDTNSHAVHFCCECDKSVCEKCLENHNKWPPNLEHRVVRVENIREGRLVLDNKVLCQKHKSDEQEHVCRPTHVCITCKKFICIRCATLYHEKKGHTVQDAEDYNASVKTEIDYLLARGKMKAAIIKDHVICIETQRERVNDHIDGKKTEIDMFYQESIKTINRKLDDRKTALKKQLAAQRVTLSRRLDEMKDADERLIASVECARALVGNSLKAPFKGDNVVIYDSLSGELKKVINRDDPEKKLATDVADRAEQLIFIPNNQGDQLSIGEVRFVKCESKCDVELSEIGIMNSLAATPDGRMAVGYSTGGIDIFSADGQLQQKIPKKISIREIRFLSDGRYVVLNDSGMTLYTRECEKLDIRFESLRYDESGIGSLTIDSNDLIYVGYRKAKKIHVFSPAGGKAITEILCTGYEPTQISNCYELLILKDGDAITVIDKEGSVKRKIKKPNVSPYAAVTQSNSILIAWVKHNDGLFSIDEYTNELEHIQTLISDHKIEKPALSWIYLQEFRSGEIAFCTRSGLYIFKRIMTQV